MKWKRRGDLNNNCGSSKKYMFVRGKLLFPPKFPLSAEMEMTSLAAYTVHQEEEGAFSSTPAFKVKVFNGNT